MKKKFGKKALGVLLGLTLLSPSLSYAYDSQAIYALKTLSTVQKNILTKSSFDLIAKDILSSSTDFDGDNSFEPPVISGVLAGVSEGGLLPLGTSVSRDGYGNSIIYCPVDNGSINNSTNYIAGVTSPLDNSPTFAIISAGSNKTFDTTCSDALSQNISGDDIVQSFSYGKVVAGVGAKNLYANKPVSNLTALNAIPLSSIKDGELRYVKSENQVYVWDSVSSTWGELSSSSSSGTGELLGGSTAIGFEALLNDDGTNNNNSAFGYQALTNNTTGGRNSATGYRALFNNTTANDNTANGYGALYSNTEGYYNTALGKQALYNNSTGGNNTAVGKDSLYSNTTGQNSVALGSKALYANTIGRENVATGIYSLYNNTTGNENIATGGYSLYENTTGINNVATGSYALFGNIDGNFNTSIGYGAGRLISDGITANTTSDYSVYLGSNTKASADNVQNEIVIGYNAIGNGSNTATIGNTSTTKLFVGGTEFVNGANAGQLPGYSTGIGFEALSNDNGANNQNSSFGYRALKSNTSGKYNVAIGNQSLLNNTTGNLNVSMGNGSLQTNTTGSQNTSIGSNSLSNNTTGYNNVALGSYSLYSNTTGYSNVGLGSGSLQNNTTGILNTAQGYQSLYRNTTGRKNSANGSWSLFENTTGSENIANGYQSLYGNTTGNFNIAIGNGSGRFTADGVTANTTSDYSTYLGANTKASADNAQNEIVIGYNAIGNGSNTATIGNTSTTDFYVGNVQVVSGGALVAPSIAVNDLTDGYSDGSSVGLGSGALANDDGSINNNVAIGVNSLNTNSSGNKNIAIGSSSMYSNTTGYENISLGNQSMFSNTSGRQNTAIGSDSMQSNTTGIFNTAVGYTSLNGNTTGTGNTGLGYKSLRSNSTGNLNTALGYNAIGAGANTASNNTAVGSYSLFQNTTGTDNIAVGYSALYSNNTGTRNVSVGYSALNKNISGGYNVAIGSEALRSNVAGAQGVAIGLSSQRYANDQAAYWTNTNTSVGVSSLRGSTTPSTNTGIDNSAFGYQSLLSNTSGFGNTASGHQALYSNTTGNSNVAIGKYSGKYIADGITANTTSDYSTYLGANTKASADNAQNEIVIGYNAIGRGSNTVTIGNSSITAIGGYAPWSNLSDVRYKKNIETIDSALDKVKKMRGVYYDWKNKATDTSRQIGFVAQEVEKVIPEVITISDNKEKTRMVAYAPLVALNLEAIKELDSKVLKKSEYESDTLSQYSDNRLISSSSDLTGKEAISIINELNPKKYTHKGDVDISGVSYADLTKQKYGFIAQDLLLNDNTKDMVLKSNGYYKVDYQQFIPTVVKAVQELNAEQEIMNDKIAANKKKIEEHSALIEQNYKAINSILNSK